MVAADYWDGWWLERHHELVFDTELLERALAVWRQHAHPIPARAALSARILKPFLPHVCLAERPARGLYRVRLMGSRVAQVIGEMQGRSLEDCLAPDVLACWTTVLDPVIDDLRPFRVLSCIKAHGRTFVRAEILVAPLLDANGKPTIVLSVTSFRSGLDTITHAAPAGTYPPV